MTVREQKERVKRNIRYRLAKRNNKQNKYKTMSNITTYPGISVVAGEDLMIISDISTKGNPTRSVSVSQLGNFIGASGGGAGVATVNGLFGALTLTPGTNVTFTTVGNNITINSGSSAGTVTSVSSTTGGTGLDVLVTNDSTTPAIAFTWAGNSNQYINGQGNITALNTIPTNLTLDVDRTTGDATLTGNVLNIPNYGSGGGGGIVTSLVVNRTSGDSTLIAGVLNIPNYTDTTNFNVDGDGGLTGTIAKNGTLSIVGNTGLNTLVSQPVAGSSTVSISLVSTGVSAGTYTNTNLVVDSFGRITSASNGSGSGGLASVSSGVGLISTGTSADPIINVKLSGNDNYILSGTNNNAIVGADMIPYTDSTTRNVAFASVTSIIDNGVGYTSAALRLTPSALAAPAITVLHNSIGGTFSIVRSAVGNYVLSNTLNSFTIDTVCFISNPHTEAPSSGTGSLPQPTTIKRDGSSSTISTGDLRIRCYKVETGTVSGSDADFGVGSPVMVEIRKYGASS